MAVPPDRIDYKIMWHLQEDGRISAKSLSEIVNLSARATLTRIRDLEEAKHIRGYRAELNRTTLGPHVAVFAEIVLKDHRLTATVQFERHVSACPHVVACYLVSGRYDYLVRFGCRDLEHYTELSNAWLDDGALGIEKIVTNTELKTIKEFRGFPMMKL